MRIRKNAKISTLFCANANASNGGDECLLQKSLCQLNQSPWDIITFPSADSSSSLHQFDDYKLYYDVNHDGNGSSIDSIGDFERKTTLGKNVASVTPFEGENDHFVDMKNYHREILGFVEGEINEVREDILLCDVRDEKGWQCGKVVKNGETVCDHHIIELQSHAVWTTKKKPGPGSVHRSMEGTRSRQTKKRASTSPYEFYYYSGFGPSWGKKRGTGSTSSNTYNEPAKVASNDNKVNETGPTNNDTGLWNEEGKRFEPETCDAWPEKVELTYIDDDDENKKGKIGKKRGRKPIKARSLKSLM